MDSEVPLQSPLHMLATAASSSTSKPPYRQDLKPKSFIISAQTLSLGSFTSRTINPELKLYSIQLSKPETENDVETVSDYFYIPDIDLLFEIDSTTTASSLIYECHRFYPELFTTTAQNSILKAGNGNYFIELSVVESLATQLGLNDFVRFCSQVKQRSKITEVLASLRAVKDNSFVPKLGASSIAEELEILEWDGSLSGGSTPVISPPLSAENGQTNSPEDDSRKVPRIVTEELSLGGSIDSPGTPSEEKRKRKRLSINTSFNSPTSGEHSKTDDEPSSDSPAKTGAKRKLSEKRGSVNLSIQPPSQMVQKPTDVAAHDPASKPPTLPSLSSNQPQLPPFSPQQYKFGQLPFNRRNQIPQSPITSVPQQSSLLNPQAKSRNHQQNQNSHQGPLSAAPLSAHPMGPPTAITAPLVSRGSFLSVFEQLYDQMEETATLQRTLREQIRKSTALLQTLQTSGTMIEGLVKNHFTVMQHTYGEKFGAALTQLNKRLMTVEDKLGIASSNSTMMVDGQEKTGTTSNAPGMLAPPILGPGGAPFSANGRFHGPLSAATNGGVNGLLAGGVGEQMLKSMLERLETLEKKVNEE